MYVNMHVFMCVFMYTMYVCVNVLCCSVNNINTIFKPSAVQHLRYILNS